MASVVRYLLPTLIGLVLWTGQLAAQGGTGIVAGQVLDSASRQPLANVTVQVLGTQRGAMTGPDGRFTIPAVPEGVRPIRFNRIGYVARQDTARVMANQVVSLDVSMAAAATTLSDVVVVGYGTQRREAVTGSVATVQPEQALVGVQTNANELLTARVAGVSVVANNGEPGGGAQVRIRGGTSISASNEPLYVIDGVPIQNEPVSAGGIGIGGGAALPRNPLNLLNPNDIASITVLKDASATAIYGSRGANGVVLIETKRGTGAPIIEYEAYVANAQAANEYDFLTGNEYTGFVEDQVTLWRADSASGVPAGDRSGLAPSALDGLLGFNTNWEDALYRNALTQNHNLSFAGGSQATQYRASLNYFDQNGVVVSNGLERYQGRLNAQHQAFEGRFRLGLNLTASRVENDYLAFENTGGFEGGVFANIGNFNPTFPIYDPNDPSRFYEIGVGSQSVRNPLALAEQIQDEDGVTRVLGNVTAALDIIPSLTGQVTVGVDRSNSLRRTYFPLISPVGAQTSGRARQVDRQLENLNFQALLTWSPQINVDNEFDIVGGYEWTELADGEFGADVRGFSTDAFGPWNLGAGSLAATGLPFSFRNESRLASFFTRANYGFKNRYFLTGVLRYDGSSRLAEGNQWSVFPALSGSWRISEEAFMQNSFFNTLSLRAGWGLQGNQAVAPYATLVTLEANSGASYPFGSTVRTGVVATRNANPDLEWETSEQFNVGLDYGVLNNRLTGTLDFYQKTTRDLLLEVAVPQPAFVANRFENIGSLRNRGLEASLDYSFLSEIERTFSSGLVLTVERNEVLDLGGRDFIITGSVSGQGLSGVNAQRIIPGEPLGTFYGPEFVGVSDAGQQLFNDYDDGELVGTTTNPGDDDFRVLGNANPNFSLGLRSNLNWGRFDASWLWRGEFGQEVFNNTALVYGTVTNVNQGRNFLRSALNSGVALGEPAIYSSRWIEDASFLRLQNLTVGYSFRLPGVGAGAGAPARVFLSGDNLLLFTDYSGLDPEVFVNAGLATRGIDYLVYPRARTYTLGMRVQF